MKFHFVLLLYFLGNINTFTFGVQKYQREYCFSKEITLNDQRITFNYWTIGEKKEYVDAVLRQMTPKRKDIYSTSKSEMAEFKTNPLMPGKYNLCFYPYSTDPFSISFNYQSSEEDGDSKDIATDTQFKEIKSKMEDIKNGLKTLENNSHKLIHRKFIHFMYLSDYISQIKILTFVKIIIVGLISLFQIYVIRRMFGDDKRMSQIKTNPNASNKLEFL